MGKLPRTVKNGGLRLLSTCSVETFVYIIKNNLYRVVHEVRKDYMKEERINTAASIAVIALFNFLFLGTEYLFDNMMMYVADSKGVVLAQSYILGASFIGFALFPVISRWIKDSMKYMLSLVCTISSVVCVFVIQQHDSYETILVSGMVLFVMLGLAGSGAHYLVSCVIGNSRHLAKTMGVAYAAGILLQFLNNNCIKNDMAESIVLSIFLMIFLIFMTKLDKKTALKTERQVVSEKYRIKNPAVAGISMIICVVLMTCIFSTLDNAVTLVHAGGSVDIGQWPRLLLALSGLTAGCLYDIKGRKYMNIMMYCVTMLSTICVVVIEMGGPFLAGLIVFYLSAGFFVIFFTVGFMDLAGYMKIPEFWAGFGRAANNICAVVTGAVSISLLSSENEMAIIITALVLFALISIAIYAYSNQFERESLEKEKESLTGDEKFQAFSEAFDFTDREREVFQVLVTSDDNIQEIAEQLLISRAALYRHIGSLNEKTETKSRIGLLQFYYQWKQ